MAGWKIALWVGLVLVGVWFLFLVRGVLLPFVLAIIISSLLEPTINRLRKRGVPRGRALVIVFTTFFVLLFGLIVKVGPVIGQQLSGFSEKVEALTQSLAEQDREQSMLYRWNPVVRARPRSAAGTVDSFLERFKGPLQTMGLPATRRSIVEQYVEPHRQEAAQVIQNFFKGFLGLIGSAASQFFLLLFTPLFVWLILSDMEKFKIKAASWIPPAIRRETVGLLRSVGEVFINYLRGVTIAVGLYMTMAAIVLSLLGAPYSVLLGILFGAVYLIPLVGPAISIVSLFVITGLSGNTGNWWMSMGDSWAFAAVITALFVVCHVVFDQLIYPRLVGKAVGLSPLASMFVVFSGGALFGLAGMLLAFPIAGSVKVILEKLLRVTSTATAETLGLPSVPLRHRTVNDL